MKLLQPPLWLAALRAKLKTCRTSWSLPGLVSGAMTKTPRPRWQLAMTCLAAVTSLLLLVMVARERPFSLFYNSVHGPESLGRLVAERNEQRESQALHYLRTLAKKTERELQEMARPPGRPPGTAAEQKGEGLEDGESVESDVSFTFTIGIITVSRKQPPNSNGSVSYLLQSAAALHELTQHSPLFRHRAFLFVCNVDAYPANHQDAALLRDLLPYAERYGGASLPGVGDLAFPGTTASYRSLRHKYLEGLEGSLKRERHDYTYCLQAAHAVPARYYLLFQDDAVPLADFADVLAWTLAKLSKCPQQAADGVVKQTVSAECSAEYPPYTRDLSALKRARTMSPSPKANFGYLKFYFPDRWNGFSFEVDRMAELVCLMMVGGGLALVVYWAWGGCCVQWTGCPPWRVFLLGAALTLGCCQLLGRQNVNELRRASRYLYRLQPSPDCCIPAMLYPAPVLPYLVSWLAESPPASKVDLRIADCFRHYDMVTYYLVPNIVRHVGVVTSIDKKNEKPLEEFLLL